jgi:aromatic ring-opening dioxygenase LigB subunit
MATIVAGCSVPHNPFLPNTVPADPEGVDARTFPQIRDLIEQARPDVVVAFSPDHLNTVFFDNLPTLLIGIVEAFSGPNDDYPGVAEQVLESDPDLAWHIYRSTLRADFDVSRSESLEVDHSVLVPLQVMGLKPVVVPIIMNVLAPPIMNASRAWSFGAAVGDAIRSFPRSSRVLVLADGGIIQEVGGPRSEPGKPSGAHDKQWLAHVVERLSAGDIARLVEEATPRRISEAGNAAGELLTVLAMLGAIGAEGQRPELVQPEPNVGHLFSFWNAGGTQ